MKIDMSLKAKNKEIETSAKTGEYYREIGCTKCSFIHYHYKGIPGTDNNNKDKDFNLLGPTSI